jgi:ABC-type transporter Mla subunit MlaD
MSFVQTSSFKPKTQDRIIGLILFLAACITIYSIYIVKSKQLSIEEWPYYFATIGQSNGLEVNASVKLSGVEIGNVVEVKLQKDTSVRLKLILNPKFNTFYTQHSYLKIDRELAINTVLEGSSLIFYPGKSTDIMKSGTSFSIKEPKSINNIVDEWQTDKVVDKAKNMIANLQSITQAIKQNNDQIDLILKNVGSISSELKTVSDKLPKLIDNLNSSNQSVQKGINRFNQSIDLVKKPLNTFLKNADELALNSNNRVKQIEPTIVQLNQLLISLNQSSQSITQLSDKISNNWLLSSDAKESVPAPIILMEERALYNAPIEL